MVKKRSSFSLICGKGMKLGCPVSVSSFSGQLLVLVLDNWTLLLAPLPLSIFSVLLLKTASSVFLQACHFVPHTPSEGNLSILIRCGISNFKYATVNSDSLHKMAETWRPEGVSTLPVVSRALTLRCMQAWAPEAHLRCQRKLLRTYKLW